MRWRLYIFFLVLTAAFCFMLLTAVTDYGSSSYHPVLSSGASSRDGQLLSTVAPARAVSGSERGVVAGAVVSVLDPQLKPRSPVVFVARNSDPVFERHEYERAVRARKNAVPPHRRVRLDDNGWYREEVALVTAYCPCAKCCGTQSPGITSTGKNAWTPGLAADPLYLPYDTRVFVQGYGLSVVDDTGGAMRRHWRRDGLLHIDLRMTYHYEAQQWGRHYLKVKIYEE